MLIHGESGAGKELVARELHARSGRRGAMVSLNCGAIAPLHHACAHAAVTRCPHLGSRPDKSLKRFPAAWVVIPLWIEARTSRPPARSVPVVSFLQLVGLDP